MKDSEDLVEEPSSPKDDCQELTPSRSASQAETEVIMNDGKFSLVVVCALTVIGCADICLYQAEGYFGPAVFFVVSAAVFCLGIPGRANMSASVITGGLLILTAWRLAWCGNMLAILFGYWLLFAYCLALRGQTPYLLRVLGFAFDSFSGSLEFVRRLETEIRSKLLPERTSQFKGRSIEYLLPAAALLIFGGVFVMANADIVQVVSSQLSQVVRSLNLFFDDFSFPHLIFWIVVTVLTTGILRPVILKLVPEHQGEDNVIGHTNSPLYSAFRNTLMTVIVVFGAYLLFEVRAFTVGKPPEGFTYSSYAHEGAAWLTVALGLSTVTLSLIFRGELLADSRYEKLDRLAWLWSGLNLLLALAVFNRMWIYVGYNGMTRMRVVGFLGIMAVVFGFVLVLIKIRRQHDFRWLLRRQSWVAGLMIWIFSVMPVDVVVHRYNVRAILAGNPAPVVQITEHPFTDECLAEFLPLCGSEDQLVSNGIKSMITLRFNGLMASDSERQGREARLPPLTDVPKHWTSRQWYESRLQRRLADSRSQWETPNLSAHMASRQWGELQEFALRNFW